MRNETLHDLASRRFIGTRRAALVVVALVTLLGAGCAVLQGPSSRRTESTEEPSVVPAPADMPPAVHDEELTGPPELEGPPRPAAGGEIVGPPTPALVEHAASANESLSQVAGGTSALVQALTRHNFPAQASARGVTVILPDSVFGYGTAELPKASRNKLHELAGVAVEQAPGVAVAVDGYTDSIGAELFNQGLSERRAKAVASELVAGGVARTAIVSTGFGSRFPIAPNTRDDGSDDPTGRARNRRVEIVFQTQNAAAAR